MVDLETMGLSYNSAIIAIGAVKFDLTDIKDTFYEVVNLQSCVDAGLVIEADTVLWWLKQSKEARELLESKKPLPIISVLLDFSAWIGNSPIIWGNGADFDNVLLESAYKACHLVTPWKYTSNRCYRTIKNTFPEIKSKVSGIKHHALDDAKNQANHLIEILTYLEKLRHATS
jgi:exodeoxyribonuclease VIII